MLNIIVSMPIYIIGISRYTKEACRSLYIQSHILDLCHCPYYLYSFRTHWDPATHSVVCITHQIHKRRLMGGILNLWIGITLVLTSVWEWYWIRCLEKYFSLEMRKRIVLVILTQLLQLTQHFGMPPMTIHIYDGEQFINILFSMKYCNIHPVVPQKTPNMKVNSSHKVNCNSRAIVG